MNKWLRREKARVCPIHQAVLDESARQLSHEGVFSKDEVLDALNFEAVAEAIRWDYIRAFLEEEQGCELVPLAAAYFKRHSREAEITKPEKFLATGHGKKTAGYGAVIEKNDHLVISRIKYRKRLANGVGEAFTNYVQATLTKREELKERLQLVDQSAA